MKEFTIDVKTAKIIPANKKDALGVYHDNNTSGGHFTITDPFVKELSTFGAHVNFISNGQDAVSQYNVTDMTIDGDTMEFSWKLDRRATREPGDILFVCCFLKVDGTEWNTTVFKDNILEGLEAELTPEEQEKVQTYYETLIAGLDQKKIEIINSLPSDYSEALAKINSLGMLDSVAVDNALKTIFT